MFFASKETYLGEPNTVSLPLKLAMSRGLHVYCPVNMSTKTFLPVAVLVASHEANTAGPGSQRSSTDTIKLACAHSKAQPWTWTQTFTKITTVRAHLHLNPAVEPIVLRPKNSRSRSQSL